MARLHIRKDCPYVLLDRSVMENEDLSFQAKGIYAFIVSCDGNVDYALFGTKNEKDAIEELKNLDIIDHMEG